MTASDTLADVALAFCREVMGWEPRQTCLTALGKIIDYSKAKPPAHEADYLFDYTDLNAVMAAVQHWLAGRPLEMEIHFGNVAGGFVVLLKRYEQFERHRVMADAHSEHDDDLCKALMAACLEAARKLRAE